MRLLSSPAIHGGTTREVVRNWNIPHDAYVSGTLFIVPTEPLVKKAKCQLGYTGPYGGVQRFLAQRFRHACLFTFTHPLTPGAPVWREAVTSAVDELTSAS